MFYQRYYIDPKCACKQINDPINLIIQCMCRSSMTIHAPLWPSNCWILIHNLPTCFSAWYTSQKSSIFPIDNHKTAYQSRDSYIAPEASKKLCTCSIQFMTGELYSVLGLGYSASIQILCQFWYHIIILCYYVFSCTYHCPF